MIPDHYDLIPIDEWCGEFHQTTSIIQTQISTALKTPDVKTNSREGRKVLKLIATLSDLYKLVSTAENSHVESS